MARARYETGTSPRKLEPDYKRQPKKKKSRLRVVEDLPRQEVKISKEQKRKQRNLTLVVIGIFLLLVTISYRNSQINEKFSEVQNLKEHQGAYELEYYLEEKELNIKNIKLTTLGKGFVIAIDENNNIYRQGSNKDGALGKNNNKNFEEIFIIN